MSDRPIAIRNSRSEILNSAAFLIVPLLAGALVLWATPYGIGVDYDSYFYLTASKNLLEGDALGRLNAAGAWIPLTHFPPLYPLTVASLSFLIERPPADAARWLAGLLMAANAAVFGFLLRWANSHRAIVVVGVLAFVSAPALFEPHLWALSEAMFFSLILIHIWALVRALDAPASGRLIFAGAIGALLYLTRYAGLALIVTSAGFMLQAGEADRLTRLKGTMVYLLSAGTAMAVWLARNWLVAGTLTNRRLGFHPIGIEHFKQAGRAVADWLPWDAIPAEGRAALAGLGALALLIWSLRPLAEFISRGEKKWKDMSILPLFLLVQGVGYGVFLLISISFVDASTRLGDRILAPAYLLLLTALLVRVSQFVRTTNSRSGKLAWAGVVVLMLLPNAVQTAHLVEKARTAGLGFHSVGWRQSETLAAIKELPEQTLIYTNEAFPVDFLTGRRPFSVPESLDPVTAQERPDLDEELGTMRTRLREQDGVLALFHPENLRAEMPPLTDLVDGLRLVEMYADGAIYGTGEGD